MPVPPPPDFSPAAKTRWQQVPAWARVKILDSVWCGTCLQGVPIELAGGQMEGDCLVLRGTCKKCGSEVARLIEPEE